jgi:hypothetical protein
MKNMRRRNENEEMMWEVNENNGEQQNHEGGEEGRADEIRRKGE